MEYLQKIEIEKDGCQVIESSWNRKFQTRIFILHPDNRLNPYYDYLYQIPFLPNGQELDLAKSAMPDGAPGGGTTAVEDAGAITNASYELNAEGLPIPVIVGYIILAVILLAIIICIYYILHPPAQQPPCGIDPEIIPVEGSECAKIIMMPNCDSRTYDACEDEWLEDDWHGWEPPENWMQWVVIGIVAVGAIVLIPTIIKAIRPESQPVYYYPPPQNTKAEDYI